MALLLIRRLLLLCYAGNRAHGGSVRAGFVLTDCRLQPNGHSHYGHRRYEDHYQADGYKGTQRPLLHWYQAAR